MKAITLTQPWATLIAIGAKQIETRSWATNYRGPLAIHAAKGLGPVGGRAGLVDWCSREPFKSVLEPLWSPGTFFAPQSLPFGCIVAICTLKDCRIIGRDWNDMPIISTPDERSLVPVLGNERAFGEYRPGRCAWFLSNVRALPEPIPAKGALSLWDWTPPAGWEIPQ